MDRDLTSLLDQINKTLDGLIPVTSSKKVPHQHLYDGARYALLGPGKRIRPLLILSATKMLGGDISKALQPACALECIHTYSLVHDDLPCIDNDDYRRGKPTVHRIYSEGHAVLVGDFLLTYAFEILATTPQLRDTQKMRLMTILSQAAGGEGMIGGQVMDLMTEERPHLYEIHSRKTGALFRACMQFAGLISECSSQDFNRLTDLGNRIGLLFQMIDDILDQENHFSESDIEKLYQECTLEISAFSGDSQLLCLLLEQIKNQTHISSFQPP
jgi:geranylgeranyl diphosphate synthase type II